MATATKRKKKVGKTVTFTKREGEMVACAIHAAIETIGYPECPKCAKSLDKAFEKLLDTFFGEGR